MPNHCRHSADETCQHPLTTDMEACPTLLAFYASVGETPCKRLLPYGFGPGCRLRTNGENPYTTRTYIWPFGADPVQRRIHDLTDESKQQAAAQEYRIAAAQEYHGAVLEANAKSTQDRAAQVSAHEMELLHIDGLRERELTARTLLVMEKLRLLDEAAATAQDYRMAPDIGHTGSLLAAAAKSMQARADRDNAYEKELLNLADLRERELMATRRQAMANVCAMAEAARTEQRNALRRMDADMVEHKAKLLLRYQGQLNYLPKP